jgi:hypothetical protein
MKTLLRDDERCRTGEPVYRGPVGIWGFRELPIMFDPPEKSGSAGADSSAHMQGLSQ